MDAFVPFQFGLEAIGGAVAAAGTVVLMLMLVAMGVYGYKQLRGGGVEWPDQTEGDPDGFGQQSGSGSGSATDGKASDTLERGDDDDEWDFY